MTCVLRKLSLLVYHRFKDIGKLEHWANFNNTREREREREREGGQGRERGTTVELSVPYGLGLRLQSSWLQSCMACRLVTLWQCPRITWLISNRVHTRTLGVCACVCVCVWPDPVQVTYQILYGLNTWTCRPGIPQIPTLSIFHPELEH